MKEKLESIAQIYAIYWKCENLITLVWKITSEVLKQKLDFFKFEEFLEKLVEEIKMKDQYRDSVYVYLPREIYVECILKVFYDLFYPSQFNEKRWKKVVQQTFSQLSNLVSLYLRVF